MTECTGGDEQKWTINSDGSIVNMASNLCIDIPNCNRNDVQLELFRCHIGSSAFCDNSKNQEWTFNSDGTIVSKLSNMCMDVYNFDGPVVQTYRCNGGSNQKWNYNSNSHAIKNKQKCLSPSSGSENLEVWAGLLSDKSYAVMLLNRGEVESKIVARWAEIGLEKGEAIVRDLWERKDLGTYTDEFSTIVNPHSSFLLKITHK